MDGLELLDEAFVVPPHHRPLPALPPSVPTDNIPLIDLSPLHHHHQHALSIRQIISEIAQACQDWGFFQVVNHGVPAVLLEKARSEAEAFFHLPIHQKMKVARTQHNAMGFSNSELTKNVRDWKEVLDITVRGQMELPAAFQDDGAEELEVHLNQWPEDPVGLRNACKDYAGAVEKLALTLLELISQSLGLPPKRFHGYFKENTSRLRLNYYRPCPVPDLVLGVGPHKDSGALTVLAQGDIGGLEVKRKDGEWMKIKPDPNAFVVNVGGLFQVWSNDRFESVEHRVVVNSERARLSIPFFLNPAHYVDVAPLPELLDSQHPPLYRPFNWGKFYKRRRDSNFKNLGVENLHIYHYAINRATMI